MNLLIFHPECVCVGGKSTSICVKFILNVKRSYLNINYLQMRSVYTFKILLSIIQCCCCTRLFPGNMNMKERFYAKNQDQNRSRLFSTVLYFIERPRLVSWYGDLKFNSRLLKQCAWRRGFFGEGDSLGVWINTGSATTVKIICCDIKRKCWMIWFYWYRLHAQSRFKYSKSMCLKFVRIINKRYRNYIHTVEGLDSVSSLPDLLKDVACIFSCNSSIEKDENG